MLAQLTIQDFALIRNLDIRLEEGFTIVSGETGAGKSIFLDAISFISGQRSSREMVRKGQEFARVEAVFYDVYNLFNPSLLDRLSIKAEDLASQQLILSREVDTKGRSTAKINNTLVSISLLREVGDLLFAIHAQNESVLLFESSKQRELLDTYAGKKLAQSLLEWKGLRERRLNGITELAELGLNPEERARELDLLRYQIEEIEADFLTEDELQKQGKLFKELANAGNIRESISEALKIFSPEEDFSVLSLLSQISSILQKAGRYSERVSAYHLDLIEAEDNLRELYHDLLDLFQSIDLDQESFYHLEQSLENWQNISRKYGPSWQEVSDFLNSAKEKESFLLNSEKKFSELRESLQKDEQRAKEIADNIHKLRVDAGKKLSQEIENSLKELNMPAAHFEIKVEKVAEGSPSYWSEEGRDKIEFYISTNPGEDLMPLAKIASGGETSRILLAIKSIIANLDQIPVLIFDEIDSGISGDTAHMLGNKLRKISNSSQVIAVTHTAQIAAMAKQHLLISKKVKEGRTETVLECLEYEDRIKELARLLVGSHQDEKAIELAGKLLGQYNR